MQKVVLDTNALFYPFQFKIDIEDEIVGLIGSCDMIVPEVVVKELIGLRDNGSTMAGAALRFSDRFRKQVSPSRPGMTADDAILVATKEVDGILVTSDRELIEKARNAGVKVIFLKGRQKLELLE